MFHSCCSSLCFRPRNRRRTVALTYHAAHKSNNCAGQNKKRWTAHKWSEAHSLPTTSAINASFVHLCDWRPNALHFVYGCLLTIKTIVFRNVDFYYVLRVVLHVCFLSANLLHLQVSTFSLVELLPFNHWAEAAEVSVWQVGAKRNAWAARAEISIDSRHT